jgi:hypothetical protein
MTINPRVSARAIRHRANQIKKAARRTSYLGTAKAFGITTPDGRPNTRAVKFLLEGYIPAKEDTLRRWGLLGKDAQSAIILDEPDRRVITGAWKINGRWVGPEEFFSKVSS